MEAVRLEIVPILFYGGSVTKMPTKPYLHRTVEVRQYLPLAKLEGKVPPFGGG